MEENVVEEDQLTAEEVVFVSVIGIALAVSVVCNILVLIVMLRTPKMMNPTNIFICNLTISDILLSGIVIPQNIHDVSHASTDYYEGDFLCRVVNFCPLMCIMASIYSMVAISFERKRAIIVSTAARPTILVALKIIPAIWGLSFVFCIPTMYEYSAFQEPLENGTSITRCGSNGVSWTYTVLNGVALVMLAYIVPLTLLLLNYGSILWFFHGRGVFGHAHVTDAALVQAQALYKGRMNVVKMLILVALLFALSWLPYFALLLLEKVTGKSDVSDIGPIFMLKIVLSVFSTAYNFLLYVVYNRNFRAGFKALFTCRRHQTRKNVVTPADEGQSPFPQGGNCGGPMAHNVTASLSLQAREPTVS
ncbi:neuropeptide FF receptor 2-like [Aplysia californica]|uniref:Neuropeptide FF receptor 2-like n=1 Tax=Aplysia californica TaxID=6500 RepID=A0ABM0JIU4_APLCA|nr:neuropeptide FF receptor 2-like [Aplysia californica]